MRHECGISNVSFMSLTLLGSSSHLASVMAGRLLSLARRRVSSNLPFHLALPGGNSPRPLLRQLSTMQDFPWSQVGCRLSLVLLCISCIFNFLQFLNLTFAASIIAISLSSSNLQLSPPSHKWPISVSQSLSQPRDNRFIL